MADTEATKAALVAAQDALAAAQAVNPQDATDVAAKQDAVDAAQKEVDAPEVPVEPTA